MTRFQATSRRPNKSWSQKDQGLILLTHAILQRSCQQTMVIKRLSCQARSKCSSLSERAWKTCKLLGFSITIADSILSWATEWRQHRSQIVTRWPSTWSNSKTEGSKWFKFSTAPILTFTASDSGTQSSRWFMKLDYSMSKVPTSFSKTTSR